MGKPESILNRRWVYPVAILIYLWVAVLSTYPLAAKITDHVILPPKTSPTVPLLQMWILDRNAGFLSGEHGYWDGNIFYPHEKTLTYSENLFSTALVFSPVYWLTGNLVLSYNLILLLILAANGFSFFIFTRRLFGSGSAALLGGILFEVSPFFMQEVDVLQLLTFVWIPVIFWSLHRYLEDRRISKLIPAYAGFWLNTTGCLYYGLMVVPFLLFFFIWHWQRLIRPTPKFVEFFIGWAVVSVLLALFLFPYTQTKNEMGFQRSMKSMATHSARPASYLSPPLHNRLYSFVLGSDRVDRRHLFPGLSLIVLALIGCIGIVGKKGGEQSFSPDTKKLIWLFLLLSGIGFFLSFGPAIWGIPSPYRFLVAGLPGFDAIRSPFRFAVFGIFFASVIATYGIAVLERKWTGRKQMIYGTGIGLILFLESLSVPFPTKELAGTWETIPQVYRWVADLPKDRVVFEYPTPAKGTTESLGKDALYAYFSSFHGQNLVNGYSGFFPGLYRQLKEEFKDDATPTGFRMLEALGVDYVLVHFSVIPPKKINPFLKEKNLRFVQRFPDTDTYVFRLASSGLRTVEELRGKPVGLSVRESQDEDERKALLRLEFPIAENQAYVYLPGDGYLSDLEVVWRAASGTILAEDRFELKNSRLFHSKRKVVLFTTKIPPVAGRYTVSVTDGSTGKPMVEKVVDLGRSF